MNEIKPRFEFRAWVCNFGIVQKRMRRFSHCQGIRESDEVYIVSAGNHANNIKIRDAKMDMKVLVEEWYGLEQWRPRMKGAFPIAAEAQVAEFLAAFGGAMPALLTRNESY